MAIEKKQLSMSLLSAILDNYSKSLLNTMMWLQNVIFVTRRRVTNVRTQGSEV